jgi:hypothetical protein
LVNIQECICDRKMTAFKCVFILACLCFSIIIIVLSHKWYLFHLVNWTQSTKRFLFPFPKQKKRVLYC